MTDQTRETTRLPRPLPTRPSPARDFDWGDKPAKPRRARRDGMWVPYRYLILYMVLLIMVAAIPTALLIYASEVGW